MHWQRRSASALRNSPTDSKIEHLADEGHGQPAFRCERCFVQRVEPTTKHSHIAFDVIHEIERDRLGKLESSEFGVALQGRDRVTLFERCEPVDDGTSGP